MSVSIPDLADVLKGGPDDTTDPNVVQRFLSACSSVCSALVISVFIDSGLSAAQAASVLRSAVVARFARVDAVSSIAASRGYLLPDNPIPTINELNQRRQLFQPLATPTMTQNAWAAAITELSEIAAGYDAGTITFDRSQPAAQLASFDVSVDGMSPQSGDALTDILGYQPDADFVKRKRALDSLALLDFSKRKPYLLFTADVVTDGKRQDGTIVAWTRMRDASGYNVVKRDVFNVIDYPVINLSNDSVQSSTARLLQDNNFKQILSFYDWVHPGDVLAFVDETTEDNTLYSYAIEGVQRKAPSSPFIFDVSMRALYLSAAQAQLVQQAIQADLDSFGSSADVDSVSPYPALAQVVYGDPGYGWILAGCNVLASRRRGDSADDTRGLSYIGAKASAALAAASAGKLFVPSDVNAIHAAIDAAVAAFGISQTLLSVLDGTGLTLFTTGKDDPLGFQPTTQSIQNVAGGLAKIISAIDPQTATIDPTVLAAALSTQSQGNTRNRYVFTSILQSTKAQSGPSLQSVIGTEIIDVTTYEGISRLLQLLRTVYDFYPGSLT